MEKSKRSRRTRMLPKRFVDSVVETSLKLSSGDLDPRDGQSKAGDLIDDRPKILEENTRLLSEKELSKKEYKDGSSEQNSTFKISGDASNNESNKDHFYCKKNKLLGGDSLDSNICSVSIDDIKSRSKVPSKRKYEEMENPTSKPKRGRPKKQKMPLEMKKIHCEICCSIIDLEDSSKYFDFYSSIDENGKSLASMLRALTEICKDSSYVMPNSSPESKDYICCVCSKNINCSYSSFVSFKTNMESLIDKCDMKGSIGKHLKNNKWLNENSSNCIWIPQDEEVRSCDDCEHSNLAPNHDENFNSFSASNAVSLFIKRIHPKKYLPFLRSLYRNSEGKKAFSSFFKSIISREIYEYNNYKNAILLQNFCDRSVNSFAWQQLQNELEEYLPLLHAAVKSAIFNKSDSNLDFEDLSEDRMKSEEFLRKNVCVSSAMANMLYLNNKRMSLIQEANSIMMFYSGCSNWMLQVFSNLGHCVPSKTLKPFIDIRKRIRDQRMIRWRKRIMKPYAYQKILKYPSGEIDVRDLATSDAMSESTETAPQGCKIVYIKGIKTSVSLNPDIQHEKDSDEEGEDELRLPSLLEEKYRKERDQNLDSEEGFSDKLIECRNKLNSALTTFGLKINSILRDDGATPTANSNSLPINQILVNDESNVGDVDYNNSYQETSDALMPLVKRDNSDNEDAKDSSKRSDEINGNCAEEKSTTDSSTSNYPEIVVQNIGKLPEIVNDGDVMYLVMDNGQSAEDIMMDLQNAGFTTL